MGLTYWRLIKLGSDDEMILGWLQSADSDQTHQLHPSVVRCQTKECGKRADDQAHNVPCMVLVHGVLRLLCRSFKNNAIILSHRQM